MTSNVKISYTTISSTVPTTDQGGVSTKFSLGNQTVY